MWATKTGYLFSHQGGSLDSTVEQMVMCARGSIHLVVPYLERCGQTLRTHTDRQTDKQTHICGSPGYKLNIEYSVVYFKRITNFDAL